MAARPSLFLMPALQDLDPQRGGSARAFCPRSLGVGGCSCHPGPGTQSAYPPMGGGNRPPGATHLPRLLGDFRVFTPAEIGLRGEKSPEKIDVSLGWEPKLSPGPG